MTAAALQQTTEESYSSGLQKMTDVPPEYKKEMDRLAEEFQISESKLKDIVQQFRKELDDGLAKHEQNIAMHQTWVHSLPSGKERGTFLTLDLGGTNLRVCQITLHGHSKQGVEKTELKQEQYKLPTELKTGDADSLWDFIAGKLEDFVKKMGLRNNYTNENPMPLGFTFSYPATQARIDHAVLKTWTKGFDIKDVEGHDVAAALREKIAARNLPVELICVINDTVGALVASAYNDPKTIIGAIFGTGCNAAYMAELDSIGKMKESDRAEARKYGSKMAINCEYGAFDNAGAVLPRTKYDAHIDEASPRPGEQAFEKLSAGLYLGEILRLVLLDLQSRGVIFQSRSQEDTSGLNQPYALDTAFLSTLEDDSTTDLSSSRAAFKQFLNISPSDPEIQLTRRLAALISTRAARLCACGVAALCLKEGISEGHVAADGSVANKHPQFKKRWARALGEVLGWDEEDRSGEREETAPIRITSAEDGSGIGCAVVAAMEVGRREAGRA
jgi:hexokinase